MKTYIGTKQVKAEPMDELAAVEKGYARKNDDNHEWRQGYHVQYANPDGSTYDSWSPKHAFEQAYKRADDFLDRLQIEHDELYERFNGLEEFFKKGFDHVAEKTGLSQASLLLFQRMAMKSYLEVLEARIDDLRYGSHAPSQTQG